MSVDDHCVPTTFSDDPNTEAAISTTSWIPTFPVSNLNTDYCPGSVDSCKGKTCVLYLPPTVRDVAKCKKDGTYIHLRLADGEAANICYSRKGRIGSWSVEKLCPQDSAYDLFSKRCVKYKSSEYNIEGNRLNAD